MAIFRILVTGGADYENRIHVEDTLDDLLDFHERLILIHGDCPTGADRAAKHWAQKQKGKVFEVRCPADWNDPFLRKMKMEKMAGHARNDTMLEEFRPDMVVAFPGASGTADCVAKAMARGVQVKRV